MEEKILVAKSSMPPYEEYCKKIKPLWDSHWLTNMGQFHKEFECELSNFFGSECVSLMVNGHMSLELCIQAMNFPIGAEIITTPFTFISTTHAIIRNNLKPVFCDVNINNGTIDVSKIEELITPKTVAIVPVHVYGNLCDYKTIEKIAEKYQLKVIYDAAHAFGIEYNGVNVAKLGDASCFSFHATKCFNSIEGGAVVFSDETLYSKLQDLKNFGIRGEELVSGVGAISKMNEFCAIMGFLNLQYFVSEIEKRKRIVELYKELLCDVEGINVFLEDIEGKKSNYSYFPVIIDEKSYGISRDQLYINLKKNNIYSRKYFYPITADQACFKNEYKNASLTNARLLSKNILVLPLYADLEKENVIRIAEVIKTCKKSRT